MEKDLNIVAFIFARGGSKGVPGKNIRPLDGKPLIAHSIDAGRRSKWIKRIIVSTDDYKIAEIASRYGAEIPFMRPMELSQDNSPEWAAWQHALKQLSNENLKPIDVFISLPATSPLRSVKDVDKCISMLVNNPGTDLVITVKKASRHPSFNMVVIDETGYAHIALPSKKVINCRQLAPTIYDMTTVAYAAKPEFILNSKSLFDGNVKAVVVPEERAVDIDTELDFQFAEFLIKKAGK